MTQNESEALLEPTVDTDEQLVDVAELPANETLSDTPTSETSSPTENIQQEVIQDNIPMYASDRKGNLYIDVSNLARDAREDIDRVRVIGIPAPVKRHHIGNSQYEAPTLSEIGGGSKNNFCQIIADKEGRPVSVNEVHYINTDPTRININHGTASVSTGTYFAIGWEMKADRVILIYEVVGISEYISPNTTEKPKKQIAKLTCNLAGYSIVDWKKNVTDVPSHLNALLHATISRLRNDTDFPFYMDIFRMSKPVDELNSVADTALETERDVGSSEFSFKANVVQEIIDIRYYQYQALPASDKKRRVDPVRLVETLTLDPNGLYVDITLTPYRTDVTMQTFHLRLTHSNFEDEAGRALLERGLTLGLTSFDRLVMELESRKKKPCVVHLTSLR